MYKYIYKYLFIFIYILGRYREAAPCLSAALDLEPSNKQIKEALAFAERKLFMSASGMSK
jgi:Flp pilus assembly protein TadD